jgi:hypothetical protein
MVSAPMNAALLSRLLDGEPQALCCAYGSPGRNDTPLPRSGGGAGGGGHSNWNSGLTDRSSWVRRIASASSGAIDTTSRVAGRRSGGR